MRCYRLNKNLQLGHNVLNMCCPTKVLFLVKSSDSLLVRAPDLIERLRVQILAGATEEFSPPESTLCADSYSVSFPPRVTAVACKRPRSFCQKCRWQVTPQHAYTSDPMKPEWAGYMLLSRHSVGTNQETSSHPSQGTLSQSSQLAKAIWTDPGQKSGISVHELISTLEKKKKCRQEMNCRTFSQNPPTQEKSNHLQYASFRSKCSSRDK